MNNTFAKRIIAIVLALSMLVPLLSGCTPANNLPSNTSTPDTSGWIDDNTNNPSDTNDPNGKTEPVINASFLSYNWEDHIGNIDTFVYGLIVSEFQKFYDVFDAVIKTDDGINIYGIGYTDYAYYFESEDGSTEYFPAGFIALIGEPDVPSIDAENGIEIINLDSESDTTRFVLAYSTESNYEHCVIWNQYLKYGIDTNSRVTYHCEKYIRGSCDESLGDLYSFDEQRFVFVTDVGSYKYITGQSLSELIDYSKLEDEINSILEAQDENFATIDVQSAVYVAREAVTSYLLSLQEESFLGCSVEELIEISKNIDPMECIRITPNGAILIEIEDEPPTEPTALTKWLVGAACFINIGGCIALDIWVPWLAPVSGAVMGASIETFMQVIVENRDVKDVQWSKVAISSLSSCLLAWACPACAQGIVKGVTKALGETALKKIGEEAVKGIAKMAGYAFLTFSNAMVSGATSSIFAKIDGGSDEDAKDAFKTGATIAAVFTILTAGVSEIAAKAVNKLAQSKPDSWLIKTLNSINSKIGDKQVHLKNDAIESILAPKSVYCAAEMAMNELKLSICGNQVLVDRINQLPSDKNVNFKKFDANGNEITKADLLKNGGNGYLELSDDCDDIIKQKWSSKGVSRIKISDGVPDMSTLAELSFDANITGVRSENYDEFFKYLANEWKKDDADIPADVLKIINAQYSKRDLTSSDIQNILSTLGWTPHEGTDGKVYLIDSYVHSKISHSGGVATAKAFSEVKLGTLYLSNLSSSSAKSVVGTLIPEAVTD